MGRPYATYLPEAMMPLYLMFGAPLEPGGFFRWFRHRNGRVSIWMANTLPFGALAMEHDSIVPAGRSPYNSVTFQHLSEALEHYHNKLQEHVMHHVSIRGVADIVLQYATLLLPPKIKHN
jgi:hypothetical protein